MFDRFACDDEIVGEKAGLSSRKRLRAPHRE
jgi:hypothetical protein